MLADETLSNQSMRRLMHGLVLFKSGLAPWLIVSGPRQGSDRSEAAVRSDIAVRLGVPAAAILQMENVNTTRDEAFTAAGLLSGRNLNRVLLVTEPLHMRRSKGVFEAAGMKVFPAPSDNFAAAGLGPVERLLLLKDLAVQSAGLLYYRLAGFI